MECVLGSQSCDRGGKLIRQSHDVCQMLYCSDQRWAGCRKEVLEKHWEVWKEKPFSSPYNPALQEALRYDTRGDLRAVGPHSGFLLGCL